ncbi:hypothetical protein EDWATA_00077 [Edwardsiella tarda ATCC 23685]|uniref:Uncharacterized protein n=1 Tax=Edwardsiella tarda ATCC 23685 TaxID=500638 RepID=D4F055_EDWTA|nr:hypothetical protein EDWATA_00077 [Edwardsiella tarda ATCC 23685]
MSSAWAAYITLLARRVKHLFLLSLLDWATLLSLFPVSGGAL